MTWFRKLPLRRQLFIALGLLLVPLLMGVVWSGRSTLRERQNELREQARLIASATAAYVDNDMAALDNVATGISRTPEVRTLTDAALPVLRNVIANRPTLLGIVLVRPDGSMVATVGSVFHQRPEAVSQVVASGQRVVTPMETTAEGMHYMGVAYPVRDSSAQVAGALCFLISLDAIQRTFASLPLPSGSVVTVTDEADLVLIRSVDPSSFVGKRLHGGTHFADGQESTIHSGGDGVRRVYVRQKIERGPWVLSVGIPMQVALVNASSVWTRGFAILVLAMGGWFFVAVMFSKRLSSSVQHLEASAQRIAAGEFGPVATHPMSSRELVKLQDAFAQMLDRFNDTRAELDRHLAEERRIRQELQSLQRQVIRQERLAAVGQLVSGVAHEINNPLQAILGFAELLQMQSDVPDSVKGDLRVIQKESARACTIIRNLAMFARQQPAEAAPVLLTDVVNAVMELRQRRLETENIDLIVEDKASKPVLAVLTELQQVALNFVVNAEHAIKSSGRLPGRITVRTYDAGDYVGLEVEDTGLGIPPENEAKLFQPFFTTKPVGMGTGLGLSVSYGIIESLGGRIGYRNAAAGGAIFYFELPAEP